MHPFAFAEALSNPKYTIFSWELNCILNALVASSSSLEEMPLAAICDCSYIFKRSFFQTGLCGIEMGEVILVHRKW